MASRVNQETSLVLVENSVPPSRVRQAAVLMLGQELLVVNSRVAQVAILSLQRLKGRRIFTHFDSDFRKV